MCVLMLLYLCPETTVCLASECGYTERQAAAMYVS
jgi:hypothetical protein